MKLSEHFASHEFACKCCGAVNMDHELIRLLEEVRALYGAPMYITSGYRCEAHNRHVRGASGSYHCRGKAVDISVSDGRGRFKLLSAALAVGFRRIGIYQYWIHVDIGEEPADVMWVG